MAIITRLLSRQISKDIIINMLLQKHVFACLLTNQCSILFLRIEYTAAHHRN